MGWMDWIERFSREYRIHRRVGAKNAIQSFYTSDFDKLENFVIRNLLRVGKKYSFFLCFAFGWMKWWSSHVISARKSHRPVVLSPVSFFLSVYLHPALHCAPQSRLCLALNEIPFLKSADFVTYANVLHWKRHMSTVRIIGTRWDIRRCSCPPTHRPTYIHVIAYVLCPDFYKAIYTAEEISLPRRN